MQYSTTIRRLASKAFLSGGLDSSQLGCLETTEIPLRMSVFSASHVCGDSLDELDAGLRGGEVSVLRTEQHVSELIGSGTHAWTLQALTTASLFS
jgi:hypothetical protein